MQTQPRLLVLMRHARAEQFAETDQQRELEPRGHRDAAAAGAWLEAEGIRADHAIVSAAVRTQQTFAAMAEAAGWAFEPEVSDSLYAASPETALDIVREAPEEVMTLVVIGHNPTVSYLAQVLDDGNGDPEAAARMAGGYPPAALTVFALDGPWEALELGSATVRAFHVVEG